MKPEQQNDPPAKTARPSTARKRASPRVAAPAPGAVANETPPRPVARRAAAPKPVEPRSAAPEPAVPEPTVSTAPPASSVAAVANPPAASSSPNHPLKPPKLKKPRPVRDSFTMPRAEYELIDLLKRRLHARGIKVKKSELLRAGILALADMVDAQLFIAIAAVPVIKTGRPRLKLLAHDPQADVPVTPRRKT